MSDKQVPVIAGKAIADLLVNQAERVNGEDRAAEDAAYRAERLEAYRQRGEFGTPEQVILDALLHTPREVKPGYEQVEARAVEILSEWGKRDVTMILLRPGECELCPLHGLGYCYPVDKCLRADMCGPPPRYLAAAGYEVVKQ